MEFFSEHYLGIKALHLIALISWMAMLFYLPRLFVYHTENIHNSEFVKIVQIQEKRLYTFIGLPALIVTFASGAGLVLADFPHIFQGNGWFHAKLSIVLLLLAYHLLCGAFMRSLANGNCKKSGKFFRIFNEVPTLMLIIIVVLVVLKPF